MSRGLWAAVVVLALFGVFAAAGRALYVDDWAVRAEPVREAAYKQLNRTDPNVATRRIDVAAFDKHYATHRVATMLHVLPGALFLLLAPFQFSKRIRSRSLNMHRWLGRGLMIAAIVTGLSGLFFGIFIPFAGMPERIVVVIVGAFLLLSITRGFLAIRRGDQARHREWMIRAFAVSLAISVIRFIAGALDMAFTPDIRTGLAWSLWLGWVLCALFAEWWIRHHPLTRQALMPA